MSALRHQLSPHTRVLELGYIASEFRATITLGHRVGGGLPTFDTHFFEFVERDRWDRGEPEFLTLDRIRKGADYYIVVTTPSGLYRYLINDLVRVAGFLHKAPLLRFVQKGKGVTNITGEKLYECQVLDAVRKAMDEMGCALRFVMMLADEEARAYRLYIEPVVGPKPTAAWIAKVVDAKLANTNLEYQAKRESDRLGPIEVHWLREQAGDAYKQFCVVTASARGSSKPRHSPIAGASASTSIPLSWRPDHDYRIDRGFCAPDSIHVRISPCLGEPHGNANRLGRCANTRRLSRVR